MYLAHGGGSFAWLLSRVAHLWDATHETPAHDLARDVYVDSVVFDHRNAAYLHDRLGPDRILFGTDHPMAGADALDGSTLERLPVASRRLIERENAVQLVRTT